VTVTHLTPPLAASGLYKGLSELKDSLTRWRGLAPDAAERDELEELIAEQAEAVDLGARPRYAVAEAAGNRGRADPRWAACRGPPDGRGGAGRTSA
jgi:cobalamin biosynthesis Mg chelatase CobN